ncbi:MAG: hypothetical protein WC894_06070, partial [Patescibacteria group bacterium]
IVRGVAPTQIQSQAFINALKNFDKTTDQRILLSLGIGINPQVQGSTPLPNSLAQTMSQAQPVTAGVSLEAIQSSTATAMDLVNNFIKHPDKFLIPESDKVKAKEAIEGAMVIVDVINSTETQLIQDKELKINHIIQELTSNGFVVKRSLVSQLVYNEQCVPGLLALNNGLVNEGVPGFVNMESLGHKSAKSFAGPLIQAIVEFQKANPNSEFVGLNVNYGPIYIEAVDQISKFNSGDTIVIYLPWMGNDELKNPGHIAQVLFTGKNEDGSSYMLIFDTNGDEKGTTAIRKIEDLTDFISQEAKNSQQHFPGTEPIFVLIKPKEQ